jgi:hypothetical protein
VELAAPVRALFVSEVSCARVLAFCFSFACTLLQGITSQDSRQQGSIEAAGASRNVCRMEPAEHASALAEHASFKNARKLEHSSFAGQTTQGSLFGPHPSAPPWEQGSSNALPSQVDEYTGLSTKARRLSCPVPHRYFHPQAMAIGHGAAQQQVLPSLATTAPPPIPPPPATAEETKLPMQSLQARFSQSSRNQETRVSALQRNLSDSGLLRPPFSQNSITRKDIDCLEVWLGSGISSPKRGAFAELGGPGVREGSTVQGQRINSEGGVTGGHRLLSVEGSVGATPASVKPFHELDGPAFKQSLGSRRCGAVLTSLEHRNSSSGGYPGDHEAGLQDLEKALNGRLQQPHSPVRNSRVMPGADESYCETSSLQTTGTVKSTDHSPTTSLTAGDREPEQPLDGVKVLMQLLAEDCPADNGGAAASGTPMAQLGPVP